jgi:hypothetical protein
MRGTPALLASLGLTVFLSPSCRCGGAASSRAAPVARTPAPTVAFQIPRTVDPIVIDGEGVERSWHNAFRSPPFKDSIGRISPHTELRAVADDDNLYLLVYVGDIDIRSQGDEVTVDVGSLRVVFTPTGGRGPEGVRVTGHTDDTIDKPSSLDEEWIGEAAIPWMLLGTRSPTVHAVRVDVGHDRPVHELAWPAGPPAILQFDPGLPADAGVKAG